MEETGKQEQIDAATPNVSNWGNFVDLESRQETSDLADRPSAAWLQILATFGFIATCVAAFALLPPPESDGFTVALRVSVGMVLGGGITLLLYFAIANICKDIAAIRAKICLSEPDQPAHGA